MSTNDTIAFYAALVIANVWPAAGNPWGYAPAVAWLAMACLIQLLATRRK